MTLKQTEVRKLFYRLGFTDTPKWTEDKLREMARDLVLHLKEDQIPKRYKELYAQLSKAARTREFIVWETVSLKLK